MTYHKLSERVWSRFNEKWMKFIPIAFAFQQKDIGIDK